MNLQIPRKSQSKEDQSINLNLLSEYLITQLNTILISKKIELKEIKISDSTISIENDYNWQSVYIDTIKAILSNIITESLSIFTNKNEIVIKFGSWNGSRDFLRDTNIASMLKYLEISTEKNIKISLREVKSNNLTLHFGIKFE